jgi:lysophospholipase L1-like esterase
MFLHRIRQESVAQLGLAILIPAALIALDLVSRIPAHSFVLRRLDFYVGQMHNGDLNADAFHALAAGYYEGIERAVRIGRTTEETADYQIVGGFLRYQYKPGVHRHYEAGMRVTNSLGMPNAEYGYEKPAHTWRIAWLGDSVSVGPYGSSFEKLLEDRLNRDRGTADIQILNFSVPGYSLAQKAEVALEKAPKFHPDAYVIELSSLDTESIQRQIASLVTGGIDLKYDFLKKTAAQAGVQRTDHWAAIVHKLDGFQTPMERWAIETIRDHAAAEGARTIIVLASIPIDPAITSKDFDLLHRGMDGLGVPIVDLRDTFKDAKLADLQVSEVDIHPNAPGHRMLAEDLYQKLRSQPELLSIVTGGSPAAPAAAQ